MKSSIGDAFGRCKDANVVVEQALEPFKNDQWFTRRLELGEVIDRLKDAIKSFSIGPRGEALDDNTTGSNNQRALILDWIRFVEFLRDQCGGGSSNEYISDKQWGQLMNLMGVSRKLNHRSAKFKDIIKCKQSIEANASEIRKFNESIRFQFKVETLINELRTNLDSCQLLLLLSNVSGDSSTNRLKSISTTQTTRTRTAIYNDAAVEEIVKCKHNLESRCGPIIYSLNVQLNQKKLVSSGGGGGGGGDSSGNADNCKQTTLRRDFVELKCKFDRLCQFLANYQCLGQNLAHLSPLVTSFSNQHQNESDRQDTDSINVKFNCGNDLLQNSLALCKQKFKTVLDFSANLSSILLSLTSQKATTTSKSSSSSTPSSSSSSSLVIKVNSSSSKQQVVVALQLVKLLTNKNEFGSDLFSLKLKEALLLSIECQVILDKIMRSLRLEYGRFYFINDLELLTIISLDSSLISQNSLPANRLLISKIFNQAIVGFTLVEQNKQLFISGVENTIGEKITLLAKDQFVPLKKRVNIYSLEIVRILNEILRKLRKSLRKQVQSSIEQWSTSGGGLKSPENDIDWSLPVQLLELVEQTKFTQRVEAELNAVAAPAAPALARLVCFYEKRLESLKSMFELAGAAASGNCDNNKLLIRLKVSASVSITVHFLSILFKLQALNVNSITDWNWFKLPRYYYYNYCNNNSKDDNNDTAAADNSCSIEIRIANTKFSYKFDLLPVEIVHNQVLKLEPGNDLTINESHVGIKRLIATETSERCFLVASQSVSTLKLGASPFGPAGSGKTETIKALGHLVGCQVIVHNCDETNQSDALERLIWGLAHTGLWGCFDEFNRLSSNTLSSVSQVLELVQTNLRLKRINVELSDGQIKSIDSDSAFFITLNPGDSSAYRGRRRLPANLRTLFVPIAMVRVQIDSIVSGLLLAFSASFEQFFGQVSDKKLQLNASSLVSNKLSKLDGKVAFEIGQSVANWIAWAREHFKGALSNRCEWDLRLVMVILKRFKLLMLNQASEQNNRNWSSGNQEDIEEGAASALDLLVESIKCEVEPRLALAEIELLTGSLDKFFTRRSVAAAAAVQAATIDDKKTSSKREHERRKSIQFNEQLKLRSGVILLGQAGAGKSTCWRNQLDLANNRSGLFAHVRVFALNPKAYDKSRLFGYFDNKTSKWIDGIFTKLVRSSLKLLQSGAGQGESEVEQIWLVLDGGLDPDWIECLNSVLDDNQVLTLSSGERLNFVTNQNKCIKLIIETDDIQYASPATISRLGLVYFESQAELNEQKGHEGQGAAAAAKADAKVVPPMINNGNNLIIIHGVGGVGGSSFERRREIGKQYCQRQQQQQVDSSSFNCFEYVCSELSNSDNLIEILTQNQRHPNQCFLLHNLDSIQAADKWNTRTFLELLRFVITYKCYYDASMNCVQLDADQFKFVATLESLSDLQDERLSSLGTEIIEVDRDEHEQIISSSNSLMSHESLNEFLNCIFRSDQTRPIVSILNSANFMELSRQTCEILTQKSGGGVGGNRFELFCFNNSYAQMRSMDKLTRLLATETNLSGAGGGSLLSSSSKPNNDSDTTMVAVFLINSLELKFMDQNTKRNLYHLTNKLNNSAQLSSSGVSSEQNGPRIAFLVFIPGPEPEPEVGLKASQNKHKVAGLDYKFWSSIGKVHVIDDTISTAAAQCKAKLQALLASKFNNENDDDDGSERQQLQFEGSANLNWLANAIARLFDSCLLNSSNSPSSWSSNRCAKFDSFITMVVDIISLVKSNSEQQQRLLVNGLNKLQEFESSVELIEAQRLAENKLLAERKLQIDRLIEQIELEMKASQAKSVESKELERLQQIKSDQIAAQREKIQAQLSQVLPLIEQSKQDVSSSLKPEALNEIKTLRSPPKTIKDILDVLFIFLNVTDTSWSSIKSHLNRCSLRDELASYNFESRLTKSLLVKIEQQIKLKQESFQLQQAKRASEAIVPILNWIEAAIQYGRVLIVLSPLQGDIQRLERESADVLADIGRLELERDQLREAIAANRSKLDELNEAQLEASRVSEQIGLDLKRAQQIIRDSRHQTQRWRSKLNLCQKLSASEKEIYKLSLICSSLAIFWGDQQLLQNTSLNTIQLIESLIENDGQDEKHVDQRQLAQSGGPLENYLANYYNVLMEICDSVSDSSVDLSRFKQHELHQVSQLINLKLFVQFKHYPLVAYLVWNSELQRDTSNEELANYLCLNNIICTQDELIILKPLSENANNWQQLTELALQMNKLVLLNVGNVDHFDRFDNNNSAVQQQQQQQQQVGVAPLLLNILDAALSNSRIILFGASRRGASPTTSCQPCAPIETNQIMQVSRLFQINAQTTTPQTTTTTTTTTEASFSATLTGTKITELLMQLNDPKLSFIIGQLEHELQVKQQEAKQLESSLVKRLIETKTTAASGGSRKKADLAPLGNDLVHILSDLQRASESLGKSIEGIKEKLNEYHLKEDKFCQIASKAATFYEQFIEKLPLIDQFYSMPLNCYVKILFESSTLKRATRSMAPQDEAATTATAEATTSNIIIDFDAADFLTVSSHVMCSMRPDYRQIFEDKLLLATQLSKSGGAGGGGALQMIKMAPESIRTAARQAANFQQALCGRLADLNSNWLAASTGQAVGGGGGGGGGGANSSSLIVVLHDAKRPSPQVLVDELFKQKQPALAANLACQYYKLYASSNLVSGGEQSSLQAINNDQPASEGDKINQLESQLLHILRHYNNNNNNNNNNSQEQDKERGNKIKCICIANAHLASNWINSRLLALIDELSMMRSNSEQSTTTTASANHQRLLIILIAESESELEMSELSGGRSEGQFDSSVLDRADLKYWYDELALNLSDRFNLYYQLMCDTSIYYKLSQIYMSSSQQTDFNCNDNNQLECLKALVKDLALFHVVCQELVKLTAFRSTLGTFNLLWQANGYNFDYEQLCLALKVLEQIVHDFNRQQRDCGATAAQSIRNLFKNLLESVVYGSRMETSDDEQLLRRLLDRLIGQSSLSGATKRTCLVVSSVGKLNSNSARMATEEYANELAKLIGIEH